MKKLFPLILLSAFLFNSCKKKSTETPEITNVSTERKSLMFDFTGLQCGICTGYLPQWDAMLKNEHPYNAIGLSVHCGVQDSLDNNFSLWMATDFNVQGTPSWAEGSTMAITSYASMKSAMESTVKTKADLGIGVKKTLSGNTISITTKTVLFNDMSGDYNIAVYCAENDCHALQTGTPYVHNDVLRGVVGNNRYGQSLISGSASKGTVYDQTFTYNIGTQGTDYWNANNLRIVVVVYKMVGGVAKEVMNCNAD